MLAYLRVAIRKNNFSATRFIFESILGGHWERRVNNGGVNNDGVQEDKVPSVPTESSRMAMWTIAGLISGIAVGLFFGDYCSPLGIVGDAFVGLLTMTVLPYIIVVLVANFGRLSVGESRRLVFVGLSVLLVLWGIALTVVVVLAHSFPDPEWKHGSFFSTPLTGERMKVDLLSVFIPSNIFAALSDNRVPAVVLLCIWAGLALAGTERREGLISQLDVIAKVLMRISQSVAKLTPIGVFAIAASTAGVTSYEEFERLQAYLFVYVTGFAFLTFIALPLLVTFVTPFRYRDVLSVSRNAMLTAFATGKLIIVLPMLIEQTERLFARLDDERPETTPTVDILYPIAYPFPHVGKLISMLFVPFAAWFVGHALSWQEYPKLMVAGVFSYFGGPLLAMPFLLDLMRLPNDMFQLFLLTGVVENRLGDALGVMHLVVFALVSTCAFTGKLQLASRSVATYVVLMGGTVLILQASLYAFLSATIHESNESQWISSLQKIHAPVSSVIIRHPEPNPDPLLPGESILERVRRRGILRVGYSEDNLPFSYNNADGELVGLDIDLAHAFARDLRVTIEFVRFDRTTLDAQLENDDFDVVMSGLVGTLERSEAMQHTDSHMTVRLSFVVEDYRSRGFRSLASIRSAENLKVGFVDLSRGFIARLREALPDAELIELQTSREFFEGTDHHLDALLISAEAGAAYTLRYPEFEVVIPDDFHVSLPLYYAIGNHDESMTDFLEHWIVLRRNDGTLQQYTDYWIYGKTKSEQSPRWCVIRDVLHWVE